MGRTVAFLTLILVFVLASAEFDRIIRFNKPQDGSKILNFSYVTILIGYWQLFFDFSQFSTFRYELPNGKTFIGQTIFLHELYYQNENASRSFHLIVDDIGTVLWVSFSAGETKSTTTLLKVANPGMEEEYKVCNN